MIVPGKVEKAQNEVKGTINDYINEISVKNSEIVEKDNIINDLTLSKTELENSLQDYVGNNGTIDANNYLISAAMAYISGQDSKAVEESLNLIGNDYLESSASYEYKTLYEYLLSQIGTSVSESYYEAGLNAFNQMDYASAINDLSKTYMYNPENSEALYYLALAYYESGDTTKASENLNTLIEKFPSGDMYEKAKLKLEEIESSN